MRKEYAGLMYSQIVERVLSEINFQNYSDKSVKDGLSTFAELEKMELNDKNRLLVTQSTYFINIRKLLYDYREAFDEEIGKQLVKKIEVSLIEFEFEEEYQRGFTSIKDHVVYSMSVYPKLKAFNPDLTGFDIDELGKTRNEIYEIISNELIDREMKNEFLTLCNKIDYRISEIEEKYFKPELELQKTDTRKFDCFNIFPSVLDETFEKSKIISLVSPINDEALFIAYRNALCLNLTPQFLNCGGLTHVTIHSLNYFFKSLKDNDIAIIYNFTDLNNEEKKKAIIRNIASIFKRGVLAILVNTTFDSQVADSLALESNILMRKIIIPLPTFEMVRERVHNIGFTDKDDICLRINGMYLGYMGLNEVMQNANNSVEKIFRVIENIANNNEASISLFVKSIDHISTFISAGWIYQEKRPPLVYNKGVNEGFDYDSSRVFESKNLDEILRGSFLSLRAKCGLAFEYILTNFQDEIVFFELPLKERKERISFAFEILLSLLKLPPHTLSFVKDDRYNGLYITGKDEVHLSDKASNNLYSIKQTILHELFHGVQHHYLDNANFYYINLGISEFKYETWKKNQEDYISNLNTNQKDFDDANISIDVSNVYFCQTLEADANEFASECLAQADAFRCYLNF